MSMRFLTFLTAVAMVLTHSIRAETINWHGFVSQGVNQASDSNFINKDGELSFALTEVGFNGSYRFSSDFKLSGQAVYANGGNRYPEGARIDYLFVDWQLANDADWNVNLHLGRYKNYHWLYSATRDVPHTRPSIVLPQSIYFDGFRDIAVGSDGAALTATSANRFGEWDINWSYGRSPISTQQMRNLAGQGARGDLDQDFVHQFSVFWLPSPNSIRWNFSLLDSTFSYTAGENDSLLDGEAEVERVMLGATYAAEHWEFASELLHESTTYNGFLAPGFSNRQIGQGGYAQLRYFYSPEWVLMARLDIMDLNKDDRNGSQLMQRSGGLIPAYFAYMDQATLGLTWNLADNWRLQAEYHRVKGTGRLTPVLTPDLVNNRSKYWDMWAIQLMYWF